MKDKKFETKLNQLIDIALMEDGEDATSISIFDTAEEASALIRAKENGTLASLEPALEVFRMLDENIKIEVFLKDGDKLKVGDKVARVKGKTVDILRGERICLNILQRCSGIATATAKFVNLVKGTNAVILDTRKTAPGLRFLDKYAVICGGGKNHRLALDDMVMIKDNHIDRAGGIKNAVDRVRASSFNDLEIEVECRNFKDVKECVELNIDRIMLDNMNNIEMRECVEYVNGKIKTEASGGITEKTIRGVAETGVDYFSIGALTHSVKALDLNMKIEKGII